MGQCFVLIISPLAMLREKGKCFFICIHRSLLILDAYKSNLHIHTIIFHLDHYHLTLFSSGLCVTFIGS